jgi:adenylate cyclase, class 2
MGEMIEIEVKIRIDDPKAVLSRLRTLGTVLTRPRFVEVNTLYDFPAGTLRAARRALRLRRSGRRTTVTFKGEPRKSRSFKVREEFETGVGDAGQLGKILRALGLQPAYSYRKHRTQLRKGPLAICVDETSAGAFLELEGPRHDIIRFARSLGFGRADFIREDYVELIEREKRKGKSPGPDGKA